MRSAALSNDDALFEEARRIAAARDVQIGMEDGTTRGARELLDEAEDAYADALATAQFLLKVANEPGR